MKNDADIQHKAAFKGGAFAFENGARVAFVDPFFEQVSEEVDDRPDAAQLLDIILDGASGPEEIAGRALVLAMLLKRPSAPQTQTEFAVLMNMPRTSGQRFRAHILQCLQGSFSNSWAPAALDEETK